MLQVRRQLRSSKLHVDVDTSDRTMQKKVREAQLSQYNYILVIGDQEEVRTAQGVGCRCLAVHPVMPPCRVPHVFPSLPAAGTHSC